MDRKTKILLATAGLLTFPFFAHMYITVETKIRTNLPIYLHTGLGKLGLTPKSPNIDSFLDSAADSHKIPRPLLHALAVTESNKNPFAVSPKGAIGVLQVMPSNATRCGLSSDKALYDPLNNIQCGTLIFAQELERNSIADALRVYNGGPKALSKSFPESERFVLRVLSLAVENK